MHNLFTIFFHETHFLLYADINVQKQPFSSMTMKPDMKSLSLCIRLENAISLSLDTSHGNIQMLNI